MCAIEWIRIGELGAWIESVYRWARVVKQLMGRQGVPIKDGNLDLYLAGFTLDQQRQAGDSSAVQRRWGKD